MRPWRQSVIFHRAELPPVRFLQSAKDFFEGRPARAYRSVRAGKDRSIQLNIRINSEIFVAYFVMLKSGV